MVQEKKAEKEIEDIQNKMYIDSEMARADAKHYAIKKSIEAEQEQLTP